MGGSSSTMKSPEKVFEKELNNIESIINKIITKNDKFVDPSYNFMDDSVCNDYTMVVEDKLNKHLKIHLHDLASNIYFVPKKMNEVTLKNQNITKIDALKIDIEGFEDRALFPFFDEAPKSLWPTCIVIEPNSTSWEKDILSRLETLGYVRTGKTRGNVILNRA